MSMSSPLTSTRAARPEWGLRLGVMLVALLVAWFYYWTVESASANLNLKGQKGDYYNLLVDGFADGHLYIKADPDPRLLALPPAERPGNAPFMLDASLYQGRYYLYFGVSPVMLLYLPYALLTGHDMPEALAAVIFMLGGFGFATAWWWEVRRKYFPELGGVWALLGVVAIGLCTAAPSALRRPMFYEVAIGAGYAFTMLALWAVTRAWHRPRQRWWWLIAAGVAVGLAVGSRANLAPAGLLLLVAGAAGIAWRGAVKGTRLRLWVIGLLAAGSGAGAVGGGLAAYNYARFGNVTEFGHHHQIGTNPKQMFRGENLRFNFTLYYLKPPALNGYFPFVAPADEEAKPSDYVGREHVHGEWLWTLVVGVAALATAAGLGWRQNPGRMGWAGVWALPGLLFAGNVIVVGLTGVRSNRYMLDFHPALVLATLMVLGIGLARRRRWNGALSGAVALLVPAAVLFNVLASLQVHGFFRSTAPELYSNIAARADGLVWPWLRAEAAAVGDREVVFGWPRGRRTVRLEPLLTAGTKDFRDVVWVEYNAGGRARFVYQHGEHGEVNGDWFSYEEGAQTTVTLAGALLLPGVSHPWYGDREVDARRALKRRLRVSVDGHVRFDRDVVSYDSSPRLLEWGQWRQTDGKIVVSSGRIERPTVRTVNDAWLRERAEAVGAVRLKLELPQDRFGWTEPLVQSGGPKGFDTLAVEYVRPGYVRLMHDQKSGGGRWSEEFAVDYAQTQEIEVNLPAASERALWAEVDGVRPEQVRKDLLSVRWNGREVFRPDLPVLPSGILGVALGVNEWNSSSVRTFFAGRLVESPRMRPMGGLKPGVLMGRIVDGNGVKDERGIWLQLERSDGETAAIIWQRVKESGMIRLGWVEKGAVRWLAWMPPADAAASTVRLQIPAVNEKAESGGGWIVMDVRGQAVSACKSDFFAKREIQAWGINPGDWKAVSPAQSGEWKAAGELRLPGRVQLRFLLPPGGFTGADPLISVGRAGMADSVFLKGVGGGRYTLGVDHWGLGATETAPFELKPGDVQTLVIELGSLDPEGGLPRDRVKLILGGRVVLDAAQALYPVRPEEIVFGQNPHGMSTSNAVFRGEIISVQTHVAAEPKR